MTATCRTRRPGGWLADPLPGQPVQVPQRAAGRLNTGLPYEVIGRIRYDSGADRMQLRVARTLPSEMVRAAGRRLPGRIVYSENASKRKDGMETESRLTYREIRAARFAPARFHLAPLELGRLAGTPGVQRAFAGGAGR